MNTMLNNHLSARLEDIVINWYRKKRSDFFFTQNYRVLYKKKYDVIGYVGSVLISITFSPQIIHTCRLRKSDGLSLLFLVINVCGTSCMVVFGIANELFAIIVSNYLIMLCLFILLFFYFFFKE